MFCHCDETNGIEYHHSTVTGSRSFLCPKCEKEVDPTEVIRRLLVRLNELETRVETTSPVLRDYE